jgi:hypothetical protein
VIRLGEPGIGRISHRLAPQKYSRSEELQTNRRENQMPTFYISPAQTKRAIGSFALLRVAPTSARRGPLLGSSIQQNSNFVASPISPARYASP